MATIRVRANNPGQPNLDGRSCYGCGDDAQINVEVSGGPGLYIHELRLCGPCRCELRDALLNAPPSGGDKPRTIHLAEPAPITDHPFVACSPSYPARVQNECQWHVPGMFGLCSAPADRHHPKPERAETLLLGHHYLEPPAEHAAMKGQCWNDDKREQDVSEIGPICRKPRAAHYPKLDGDR